MQRLKQQASEANMDPPCYGLMTFIWGNVSAIDCEHGLVVIKPSGVDCHAMTVDDIIVVDLYGDVVEGYYRPSSNTITHLTLYHRYSSLGGVVHTHSTYAMAQAQVGLAIPMLNTTHTDYLFGDIPCTRAPTEVEVQDRYELNAGRVIAEMLGEVEPLYTPDVVVYQHDPSAWSKDAHDAVYNTAAMEEVAKMAWIARGISPALNPVDSYLVNKRFMCKHGLNVYYGQKQE